ncbi:MAG: ribonuclease P protein component [Lachnospiraceae bacterium]|nr:ribonuclease P protein component [Lachnospiraceae bacterium]
MENSLKNSRDFNRVFNEGKSYADKLLVMYVCKNYLVMDRIGIIVSKKIGNSVVRHRITRLIKESFRLNYNMFNWSLDIVVIARAGIREAGYADVNKSMLHLAGMHGIIAKDR